MGSAPTPCPLPSHSRVALLLASKFLLILLLCTLSLRMNGYINVTMQLNIKRGLRVHLFDLEDSDDRSDADAIAGILNDCSGEPKYEGLSQLVKNMKEVERLAAESGYPSWPYKGFLRKKTDPLFERINPFFKKHRLVLSLESPSKFGWRECLLGKARDLPFSIIVWAAERGLLGLLSECNSCHRWFAARRVDHKYCSNSCREKTFRGSNEGKAKRAAYMKRYRAGLRRRDHESLRISKKRKV